MIRRERQARRQADCQNGLCEHGEAQMKRMTKMITERGDDVKVIVVDVVVSSCI